MTTSDESCLYACDQWQPVMNSQSLRLLGLYISFFVSEVAGFLCTVYISKVAGCTYLLFDVSKIMLVYPLSDLAS